MTVAASSTAAREWRAPGLHRLAPRRASILGFVWRVALFAFAVGMLLVERYPSFSMPNRILGIVIAGFGVVVILRNRRVFGTELKLFALFILWATVSGLLVASSKSEMADVLRLVAQNWALTMGVVAYCWWRGSASDVFRGLLLVGVIVTVFMFLGGEAAEVKMTAGRRAQSLVNNPNYLGFLALWGLMSIAWLWPSAARSRIKRWVCIGLVPALVFVIVLSASRKTFLILLVFAMLWFLLSQRGSVVSLQRRTVALAAMGIIGWITVSSFLPGSTLEQRIDKAERDPQFSSDRLNLYGIGVDLFMSAPVTGVGLGNFARASGQSQYSHSDYMEILSTTGAVGFVLYFSIYGVVLWRLWHLRRFPLGRNNDYWVGVSQAIVLSQLLLGFGSPNFMSPYHWMIMAAIIGSMVLWRTDAQWSAMFVATGGWRIRNGRWRRHPQLTHQPALRTGPTRELGR